MRVTLDWLRDFVDLPTDDPSALADAFESLGHEVEEWEALAPSFRGVVIGRVLGVGPHPNADKVRLCEVDVGDQVLAIVCGAWNFEAGAVVPVAVPGAVLQETFEIGKRSIRGVESNGMICSEEELEVGEESAGIMVLNDDYPDAADRIGADFSSVLPFPDAIFDLSITPNRPDCLSVYGLARELAAYYDVPLRGRDIAVVETGEPGTTEVTITDDTACPRFAGREVRDITLGPAPHWMRARLRATGSRPISNVVDASNYAMMEFGHPTHAFDLDRLGDAIVVRHARPDERVVTLDGQDRELTAEDIVVADRTRPVAIAGVMGGAATEVHDDTTRVLVEAAYWNPPSILLTSKRLGLRSEASARFERGMDPEFCALASDRVAQLLEQIAGGRVAPGIADEYPARATPREIVFPLGEVDRILGITLARDTVVDLLGRLGFVATGDDPLLVIVPTWRPDVLRPADLVEELARLHGFDNIPDEVRVGTGGGLPFRERRLRELRAVLVGAGYHETLRFSFVGPADLGALGLPEGDPARVGIPLVNPLRDEEGVMRTTLLPGLLRAAGLNLARHVEDVRLFEVGKVFLAGSEKLPEQPDRLGFVAAGKLPDSWEGPRDGHDVYEATGLWELLADALNLPDPSVRPGRAPSFHPGRTAEVLIAGTPVGVVGEVLPEVAARFGLGDGRVAAGELDLEPLLVNRGNWSFRTPSLHPPQIFDLAFSVNEAVPASALLEAIDAGAGTWLEARHVFDVYRGAGIAEGHKSIAVRLTLRAADHTLTDAEVAPVRRSIVERVEAETGAELRGEA
jgi:phenylalanyl-tRNA synthetase beta chain